MSLFGSIKNDGMEQTTDRIGGGGFTLETDIYVGEVVQAFVEQSQSGATWVNLEFKFTDGSTFKTNQMVANKDGEAFFVDSKTKNRIPFNGYTVVDDICMVITGEPMVNQEHEEKVVSVYDFESRKDVNRERPVLINLIGGPVALAIQKKIENKRKPDDNGKYVETNDRQEVNNVVKVMHPETKQTLNEAIDGKEATYWDKWLERNQHKTWDTYKEVKGGGRVGAPPRQSQQGSAAGGSALFKRNK